MATEIQHWSDDFLTWLAQDGRAKSRRPLREATLAGYRQDLKHLARFAGEEFTPGMLTEELVQAYFGQQEQAGAAIKTMNRRLASVRVLVRWALSTGQLESDPTIRQGRFSEESLPPRAPGAERMQVLQGVVNAGKHLKRRTVKYSFLGLRDQIIWSLAAEAGLRESEIARLKVSHLDLKRGWIEVRDGKGGFTGHVKISKRLVELISTWLKARLEKAGDFVVCDWKGNGLSRSTIWRRVHDIGLTADVDVSPHDLRHGFCLNVMRKAWKDGFSPESALDVLRKQARHRDRRTSEMYLRATEADLERVMEAL